MGKPAFLTAGHRCRSELCWLVWFQSSPGLPERVLFGRREMELREVSEWEVRIMPPKLQVALYCLATWACLCLQVMFLLSLNSDSIRHPFLVQLYREGLESLSFFVLWTTDLVQLFLTFSWSRHSYTPSLPSCLCCSPCHSSPQRGYCSLGCDCTLLIGAWPLRSGLGNKSDLVAFHHCPVLDTSILLKPVKRHLRRDSSVKSQ